MMMRRALIVCTVGICFCLLAGCSSRLPGLAPAVLDADTIDLSAPSADLERGLGRLMRDADALLSPYAVEPVAIFAENSAQETEDWISGSSADRVFVCEKEWFHFPSGDYQPIVRELRSFQLETQTAEPIWQFAADEEFNVGSIVLVDRVYYVCLFPAELAGLSHPGVDYEIVSIAAGERKTLFSGRASNPLQVPRLWQIGNRVLFTAESRQQNAGGQQVDSHVFCLEQDGTLREVAARTGYWYDNKTGLRGETIVPNSLFVSGEAYIYSVAHEGGRTTVHYLSEAGERRYVLQEPVHSTALLDGVLLLQRQNERKSNNQSLDDPGALLIAVNLADNGISTINSKRYLYDFVCVSDDTLAIATGDPYERGWTHLNLLSVEQIEPTIHLALTPVRLPDDATKGAVYHVAATGKGRAIVFGGGTELLPDRTWLLQLDR